MSEEKTNNWLGCWGLFALFIVVILAFGRTAKIIAPIGTWKPTVRLWFTNRNTIEGDSIYISCLKEKAEVYSDKGYEKKELKTRKKILDYYIEKGDNATTDYAIASIRYYTCNDGYMHYCDEVSDAKRVLWNAWQNGELNNEEKELLYTSVLMLTNNVTILESKQAFVDALAVADDMDASTHKFMFQQQALCTLAAICMSDISSWSEAQIYIDRINPNMCTIDFLREECWLYKARYQLYLHNTVLAQQYLDSAKSVGCHDHMEVINVTDVQRAIYKATGNISKTIKEQKHLASLQYGFTGNYNLQRALLKYENAILRHHKWPALWHRATAERELESYGELLQNQDTITSPMRLRYLKLYATFQMLNIEFCLAFDKGEAGMQSAIAELQAISILTPDQQLRLIDMSIQTALQYPSDSTTAILQDCVNSLQKRLQYSFPHFTDGEKASFWLSEEPILRQIYAANSSVDVKYNVALLSKGLLLASSNNVRCSILESGDSTLINDWNELQVLRQAEMLNIQSSNTSLLQRLQHIGETNTNSADEEMHKIRMRADSLERSVTQRSQAYQHLQNTWDITWENVQDKLIDGECAIEIVHYPIKNDVQYDALIIRKQDSVPTCVHIGRESAYKVGAASIFNQRSPLIDTIWAPIRPYLSNGNIYISMDGIFHHLNIEAMMADKNGNLLLDLYSIVRVSSTRDLVQSVNLDIKSAALYGGVDYGKSDVSGSKDMPRATAPEETERGFIFADRKRKGFSVDSLPFTLVEVNGIDSLLKSQGCETKLYVKQMATESAFKAMSGDSIRVLHISTHGIANQLSDGNADPMRYCCLLLAGANNTLSKNKPTAGDQDGLLTASEISSLDFRGTDLVVLSACNTAGGEVTADGVFGLQRAFKQAGAQSILMSLSGINDAITAEFMREYYQQIVEGNDKRSALTRTRNIIRRKYPSSLDWASFILLD